MRDATYGELRVQVFDTLDELADAAAEAYAAVMRRAIAERGEAAVIHATGNSQLRFYDRICARDDIDWSRVTVFHMDEYLGIPADHPASFRRYMREKFVDRVRPRAFYGIDGDAPDVEAELRRYSQLIGEHRPAACVMGIGENGHLAFNDPPADFATRETITVVDLADSCRLQQVGEGHFATMLDVPERALSLTVHALLAPPSVLVIAPEARKAAAVRAALEGPVSPDCPASILRTAPHARLFLDGASAALLSRT